jgi:hypothetical protein
MAPKVEPRQGLMALKAVPGQGPMVKLERP